MLSEQIKKMMSLDHNDHPSSLSVQTNSLKIGEQTSEISGQGQDKSNTIQIELSICSLPSGNEYDSFCSITPWSMEDRVHILPFDCLSRRMVCIFLCGGFQTNGCKDIGQLMRNPINR